MKVIDKLSREGKLGVAVGFEKVDRTKFAFLAVSDHGNNRVEVFGRDGAFIRGFANIPDVLGLDVVYVTTARTRRIVAVSGETKRLYLLQEDDRRVEIPSISQMAAPYDVWRFFVTDTVGGQVGVYGWSPL